MVQRCRRNPQQGTSLLELTLVLGVVATLSMVGLLQLDTGPAELAAAHLEIRGSLDQAFALARARGTNVTVALGRSTGAGEHLPVQLSRRVKWGKPAHIPMPTGMAPSSVATSTGESHALFTVTPRRTALAGSWFLNDGREALCMRLAGNGKLQVLRWRQDRRQWTRL